MKSLLMMLLVACSCGLAQNTISGTLYADYVQGFIVIGCLLDLTINDCDYDRSPYVEVSQSGQSFPFVLDNAPDGQYLVIAWRDTNGNGQLDDDGSDELTYYADASGNPLSVTPPVSDIVLQIGGATAVQPATPSSGQTDAQNPLNNQTGSAPTNMTPTGNFPTEYVGVWVDNTAKGGFSGENMYGGLQQAFGKGGRILRIAGDGSYTLYESYSNQCATVVTSKGTVNISSDTFTFLPQERRERSEQGSKFADCEIYDREVTPTPETFPLEFTEYDGLYGWKTYLMSLQIEGGYWTFSKLKGTQPPTPQAQALPSNFVVGTDVMYNELIGRWFAFEDDTVPLDFYDAATGQATTNEYASSLTFSQDGSYELVVYRPDLLNMTVCVKNVLLVERGTLQFSITIRDDLFNEYVAGDVVLTPSSSTLTDEITDCDADSSKQTISLPLSPRYLEWRLTMPNTIGGQPSQEDKVEVFCPSEYTNERTEWIFMYCPGTVAQAAFNYWRR